MGQFKKWLLIDKGQLLQGDFRAEAAWKAALEWVKSRSEVAKSLYMINVNDIDDELGLN